jgi:hypothetical protein
MNEEALVLSDELLQCYYDFKNGKVNDSKLLERFLSYYHAPHKTTVEQLKRIGCHDTRLIQQLIRSDSLPLEELAQKTFYKIILNTAKSEYPYVNINDDFVENNLSLTFRIGENREKLTKMIKAFCQDANTILIFDKYLIDNKEYTKQFFEALMPHRRLTVFYNKKHLNQRIKTEIKKICKDWFLKEDTKSHLENSHDRYLIIDNKTEIILSSGFRNLFDISSDITCLIRKMN